MRSDSRWLVVLMGNLAFQFLVGQLDHYFSHFPFTRGPVYIFALGLPVAFAALRLNLSQGLLATALTGLAAEAALPLRWGSLMMSVSACFCVTLALRPNFNRMNPSSALATALAINAVLMVILTAITPFSGGIASIERLSIDLIFSQVFVAALTGWFFAAQHSLLAAFGFRTDTELREPL